MGFIFCIFFILVFDFFDLDGIWLMSESEDFLVDLKDILSSIELTKNIGFGFWTITHWCGFDGEPSVDSNEIDSFIVAFFIIL